MVKPAATELAERLSTIALSSPSNTKFDDLRAWLATMLEVGAERVGVKVVSETKMIGNRIGEVRRTAPKAQGRLLVLLLSGCRADQVTSYFARDPTRGDGFDAFVIIEKPRWSRTAVVVARQGSAVAHKWEEVFGTDSRIDLPSTSTPTLPPPVKPVADVTTLADELLVDRAWLDRVVWLLQDRRALVLYGPPGTGKTWIARKLATWFASRPELQTLVQLHPTYAYEDFVQGWRPRGNSGSISLDLVDGPLLQLAAAARASPDENAVMVIDELNRAFVPKVFGELFFLLEYRDEAVRLVYSSTPFSLPPNLSFIATMNTADRSIASLDQALRRRFHFVGLFPGEPPVSDMFKRWLAEYKPDYTWLAAALDLVNRAIGDRDVAIGPSHFMRTDLDDEVLGWIWQSSVLPTIAEIFHGSPDRIAAFELPVIRAAGAS